MRCQLINKIHPVDGRWVGMKSENFDRPSFFSLKGRGVTLSVVRLPDVLNFMRTKLNTNGNALVT